MKALGGFLGVFVVLPMWLYMLHFLLAAANAPAIVWGCFWAYVPLAIITAATRMK